MGAKINFTLDHVIELFIYKYEEVNQELLNSQKEMITELSCPVISINSAIGILPIVGGIDTYRAKVI